jgi:hypothetical protein
MTDERHSLIFDFMYLNIFTNGFLGGDTPRTYSSFVFVDESLHLRHLGLIVEFAKKEGFNVEICAGDRAGKVCLTFTEL